MERVAQRLWVKMLRQCLPARTIEGIGRLYIMVITKENQ